MVCLKQAKHMRFKSEKKLVSFPATSNMRCSSTSVIEIEYNDCITNTEKKRQTRDNTEKFFYTDPAGNQSRDRRLKPVCKLLDDRGRYFMLFVF